MTTFRKQNFIFNGLPVTLADIARFAPIVTLHENDQYRPSSIEYVLSQSTLESTLDKDFSIKNPTQNDLAKYYDKKYYLNVDKSAIHGPAPLNNTINAPMYVSVQVPKSKEYIDLKYIFYFAYNGSQTARVNFAKAGVNFTLETFAEHQGDIEGLKVRVSPDLTKIINVEFEAHGKPSVFKPQDCLLEGTHPVVRCAYHSHATYNPVKVDKIGRIRSDSLSMLISKIEFIDLVSAKGPVWKPFSYDENGKTIPTTQLRVVGLDLNRKPINEELWAKFSGKLGKTMHTRISSISGIGKPLNIHLQRCLFSIAKTAEVLHLLPKKAKISHGTDGLGVRPYIGVTDDIKKRKFNEIDSSNDLDSGKDLDSHTGSEINTDHSLSSPRKRRRIMPNITLEKNQLNMSIEK